MTVDIVEPEVGAWPALLAESIRNRARRNEILGESRVAAIRVETRERARQHTRELEEIARRCGVKLAESEALPDDDRHGIVMAGHQPVVFHPGLLFKARSLAKLVKDTRAFGVHVVIDTDVGVPCVVSWPRLRDDDLVIQRAPIARAGGDVDQALVGETLYSAQRIVPRAEIRVVFREMEADLRSMGRVKEADRAREIGAVYESLEGCPVVFANSIARWTIERRGYEEVPLSTLLRDTSLGDALSLLAEDAERLHSAYNACLERYRREHSIKNAANPFPNLRVSGSSYELPLWRVTSSQRHPLWSGSREAAPTLEGSYIATRGSLTTMLLRAYCCDLFVHGLGGGKYDQFVNMFTASYVGVDLPQYAIASRTRVFDEERVERLSAAVTRGKSLKEVVAQTERYLGTGIFTEPEESRLRELVSGRARLRSQLADAGDSERKSATARALNDANREVREIVQSSAFGRDVDALRRNEQLLERWSYREFPYFLF